MAYFQIRYSNRTPDIDGHNLFPDQYNWKYVAQVFRQNGVILKGYPPYLFTDSPYVPHCRYWNNIWRNIFVVGFEEITVSSIIAIWGRHHNKFTTCMQSAFFENQNFRFNYWELCRMNSLSLMCKNFLLDFQQYDITACQRVLCSNNFGKNDVTKFRTWKGLHISRVFMPSRSDFRIGRYKTHVEGKSILHCYICFVQSLLQTPPPRCWRLSFGWYVLFSNCILFRFDLSWNYGFHGFGQRHQYVLIISDTMVLSFLWVARDYVFPSRNCERRILEKEFHWWEEILT